jgi:hypothetical protein
MAMSEATFTPGPWTFAKYSAKRFGLGQCGEGAFFFLQCVHDDADSPAAIADARLCAAAPDLFQAAEQFLASVKDGNVAELIDYYADIFGEAVAKATGSAS